MSFFSSNLKFLRRQNQLNQAQLADLIGFKANTISNYEKGRSKPDIDQLEVIIKILNVNAHDILYCDLEKGESIQDGEIKTTPKCDLCQEKERTIQALENHIKTLETCLDALQRDSDTNCQSQKGRQSA